MNWLKYSGLSISLIVNPLHWSWMPWWRRDYNEWDGPNEWTGSCGLLFITIRVWIDDGSW